MKRNKPPVSPPFRKASFLPNVPRGSRAGWGNPTKKDGANGRSKIKSVAKKGLVGEIKEKFVRRDSSKKVCNETRRLFAGGWRPHECKSRTGPRHQKGPAQDISN